MASSQLFPNQTKSGSTSEKDTTLDIPPVLYPSVKMQLLPLKKDSARDYIINLNRALKLTLNQSPYYMDIDAKEVHNTVQRHSDKYKVKVQKPIFEPCLELLPSELRDCFKKSVRHKKKPKKFIDLETLAEALKTEEKENTEEQPENESTTSDEEKDENNDEDSVDEKVSAESEGEEALDYVHNYFDPGEDYEEPDEID